MDILQSLPKINEKSVITIGTFDGIHLGHQAVLARVVAEAHTQHARAVVITFANHPSTVLKPTHPTPLLCTPEHRLQLLEKAQVDTVCLLPFTAELSHQSADTFLHTIKTHFNFTTLILGSDAHIGKNRHGDRIAVTALGLRLHFTAEYLEDLLIDGTRISSSSIRHRITHGDFIGATQQLGRPYSIYGTVMHGHGRGAGLGFPTANLSVEGLCVPPFGVYTVILWHRGVAYRGVANLGMAPTMRHEKTPLLEVHLWDQRLDLYDEPVEVCFHTYMRPERHFASIEELKEQIAKDVAFARNL